MGMDISSLTGGTAASLNDELISKLRAEDEKAMIEPIEARIEDWEASEVSYDKIKVDILALDTSLKNFIANDTLNAMSTSVSGDAVIFDAISSLDEGTVNIDITSVAKKDVWQSDTSVSSTTELVGAGMFSIAIDGTQYDFETTSTTTYEDLASLINDNSNFNATVSQVGDEAYKLVIKTTDTGTANIMSFSEDLSGIDITSHVQTASNLNATVDGVAYDTASNTIKISDALSMTAVNIGSSSLNVQNDPNAIIEALDDFVEKYNTLVETFSNETDYNTETEEAGDLKNTSQIRSILEDIKSKLFASYGDDTGDKHNLFAFGFSFDTSGQIAIDSDIFNDKIVNNMDDIRELFEGTPENKGLMVTLNEYIDPLDGYNGLLTLYEDSMSGSIATLEEDKTEAIELLDTRYSLMQEQFAAYSVIIAQMEAEFSGLKQIIAESISTD